MLSKNSFRNTIGVSNSLDPRSGRTFCQSRSGSKLFAKFISRRHWQVNLALLTIMRQLQQVVCFSRLLKCLRSLYSKQCGPRSDCSYRSSLFWVHTVCFYTYFVSNARQLFAADDFSRQHFQMNFFLGALMVYILQSHFCCKIEA